MTRNDNTKPVLIRNMPLQLWQAVRIAAAYQGISIETLVRCAIRSYLIDHLPEISHDMITNNQKEG